MHSIKFLGLTLGIALSIFAISLAVYAWTAPTAPPPGGNVPAPINVGTTEQTKAGALGVGGVFRANSAVHLAVGGGNVGIGTTEPSHPLTVNSGGGLFGTFLTGGLLHGNYRYTGMIIGQSALAGHAANIGYMTHQTDTTQSGVYLTNFGESEGLTGIFIRRGGNVGIGITTPGALLHVADLFTAGGRNLIIGDDTFLSDIDVANTLGLYGNQDSTQGHIRLGSAGPVISGVSGNVGIGTTAPGERLEVAGNIRLSGATPTHRITNLAAPIASSDAATKAYVDANLNPTSAIRMANNLNEPCPTITGINCVGAVHQQIHGNVWWENITGCEWRQTTHPDTITRRLCFYSNI